MKIIIVGAGKVGLSLAEYFSALNHQISIIDQNKVRCDDISNRLDGLVVPGEGCSPQSLEEAGISSADMIVAITSSDETNLVVCNFAMQKGVKKRLARIRSSIYTEGDAGISLKKMGVTNVIEPERDMVEKICQYVELPGVIETANFQSNNIYLRGYRITEDMPVAGKTLIEIRGLAKTEPILFVAIIRAGRSIAPTGGQMLLPGDEVVAIMTKKSFKTFRFLINRKYGKMKKLVVSGDSLTSIHLVDALKPLAEQIVLADPDREHGLEAAEVLNDVNVFFGDCTDANVLQEIGVKHADCFIAAGNDPEDNIMSCLLAKAEGAKMVIAVRDDHRYGGLFNSLGLDQVVNSRDITLNAIIEQIQMVSFGTYLRLKTTDTGIVRLKVSPKSSIINRPLRKLEKIFKKSIIIGCIIREGEVIIPSGSSEVIKDDEVILVCHKESIGLANKLLNPHNGRVRGIG